MAERDKSMEDNPDPWAPEAELNPRLPREIPHGKGPLITTRIPILFGEHRKHGRHGK